MIPDNISINSVRKAIEYIDRNGIPKNRHSVKWSLEHGGKLYPSKYVISIANKFESGEEWEPEHFSGGPETNQYLERLGFAVIATGTRSIEYPLESHSWRAISDTVAIKILDKSSFLHHGSGVPRNFKEFFGLDKLATDQKVDITLFHKGSRYDAHFEMDKSLERMRLFWRKDFSELLQSSLPEWYEAFSQGVEMESDRPEMRLQRLSGSEYQVDFIRPAEIELDIDADVAEETLTRSEGATRYSYSKRYERNPENRRRAIEIHGCKCCICGFDFELVFGERGKGFIEVHHTKPLSEVEDEVIIDPETDLVPVCSNCHRMIHRRKDDVLSVDEMKELTSS